jgi:hypothetical protein
MAIDIDWGIKYYTNMTTTVDLTSYTQATSINIEVGIGLAGRATATIVLNNNTGAFTPNGTGTFASVDWFRYAFVIENKSNSSGYITSFCGMVSDVNIEVISIKESRFTLTLVDILTIAGRSSATTAYSAYILASPASQGIELMLNGYTFGGVVYYSGVDMPFLGESVESLASSQPVTAEATTVSNDDFPAGRVGDWINNNLLVTGPGTVFTTNITSGTGRFQWNMKYVDFALNRTDADATTYNFSDKSAALASGEIPYSDIDVQYNFDQVINSCTAQDQRQLFTQVTAVDSTSTAKYGVRNVAFNSTCTEQQTDVNRVASFWSNRYGTARYTVKKIQTSLSVLKNAVDDGVAETAFSKLLTGKFGVWQRAVVDYVAPGMATQQREQLVINKITIGITPDDTVVTLDLIPGVDNQSFELNSSTYGILDTNRLA